MSKVVMALWLVARLIGLTATKIYGSTSSYEQFRDVLSIALPILAIPFVFTTEGWLTHKALFAKASAHAREGEKP